MQINKTDQNDAEGLAQIVRTGWYRSVHVKSFESHRARALLGARNAGDETFEIAASGRSLIRSTAIALIVLKKTSRPARATTISWTRVTANCRARVAPRSASLH